MIESLCICSNKKVLFKPFIVYKNETVFKEFEGITIGKCMHCGILKTFSNENNGFNSRQSRFKMYESERELFTSLFRSIIKKIKEYKKTGRVLDVGCSSGLLLELLKKEKYEIYGIEPNKKAYFAAKKKLGDKIFFGTLLDCYKYSNNRNKNRFDIVIYNHVLEHIQDIKKEFGLIKKVLKKDGIFVLGIPNTDNIIFYLRGKYWEPLMPKEHIWHFSAKRITMLLQQSGYRIFDMSFSNDDRQDYSFLKRMYFKVLSSVNSFFHTGEAMLVISRKE